MKIENRVIKPFFAREEKVYLLLAFIRKKLASTSVTADRICFEITETAAIAHFSYALDFVNALRANGFMFSLDDFGTGLSSFSYLKSLPVDFLKIDGYFVKDMCSNGVDREIVRAIHAIGSALGKKT